jgi:hypothetical protein
MDDMNSLVNLGDLTKPATVLVEKISDAICGAFLPYQIKRVAKAEAEAEKSRHWLISKSVKFNGERS